MKKAILLIFLSVAAFGAIAQTHINAYNTPFQTVNQNLWKAGTAGVFQIDFPFFDLNWNESTTFGPMYEVAGFDFGARVSAGTWGQIGSGFQLNFGTEQVDILYDTQMRIERPNNMSFNKGDIVSLKTTSFANSATSYIATDTYDANMRLYLEFGMGIDLAAQICVFDCANVNIVDIDLATEQYDMVSVSSADGISILDGLYNWGTDEAFPFNYSDPNGIITLDITLPSNSGANVYFQDGNLHAFADPSDPYFNTYFSIPKFIGALHIPYVSAFFANLSNSYSAGPFYLNYILMESGLNLGLYHKQHLTLYPELKGRLDFPLPLDYEIIDPSNGSVKEQGNSTEVNYTLGDEIRFEYPCHFDFMEISPSFDIENTFNNHTYDSIALDFVFQMLEFDMGMEPITVIEEYCANVPYPCPTWGNPLKICWKEVCTPAVGFNGFQYVMGPLVDWQPNMFEVTYDWRNSSWEMEGFNTFEHMTPLLLEPALFEADLLAQAVDCYGESTGSATVQITNGKPPYIYEWSNGAVITSTQTSNTQTGLPAGTHYVNVTDANGCSVFASEVVVQPDMPLTAVYEQNNLQCFDSFDGSISATASGGTAGYTYNWNTGQTGETIDNLDAGDYSLTITDNNGCEITESFTLTKPDPIVLDIETSDINCYGGNDGLISIDSEGGVAPYAFNWSHGALGSELTNLTAGTYSVTVSDDNLCEISENITLTQPDAPLSITETIEDVICYGTPTGSININLEGGTPNYSYNWFNSDGLAMNQTGPVLSDIPAGNYTLIAEDAAGCSDTAEFIVNEPEATAYEFTITDVLCKDMETGEILLDFEGGTAPYSFVWSNGATGNNPTNLAAGHYTVVVTDDNGCTYELEAEVSEPDAALTVSTETDDVLCYGGNTGSITANAEGGLAPYTINWSNGDSGTELTYLPAGIYSYEAYDANGCGFYGGAIIEEPEAPLSWITETTPVTCYGYQDGSISLQTSGGTLPYALQWEDANYVLENNSEFTRNLEAGSYTAILTDANGCNISENFYIESPEAVSIDLSAGTVSCFGGSDAQISVSVTGGSQPYSYEWSNGSTGETLQNASADSYEVTITDSNGCSYSAETEVQSNPAIKADYEVTPPSCKDKEDGEIEIYPGGGSGQYSYLWSTGSSTKDISDLAPGVYQLSISDALNCLFEMSFQVPYNYDDCLNVPSAFTPNADGINDTWVITGMDAYPSADIQVFNKWGNLVFEHSGRYEPWNGSYKGNSLSSGTYYYIINLNNGDEPFTGTVSIIR